MKKGVMVSENIKVKEIPMKIRVEYKIIHGGERINEYKRGKPNKEFMINANMKQTMI